MVSRFMLFLMFSAVTSCGSQQRPAALLPPPSASPSPQVGTIGVIKVTENHKYQLEAIFSGEDLEVGDRIEKVITSVTIRSKVTGQNVRYSRQDGPAASDSEAYLTEVWSPDDDWLVLPFHRFGGFCIIRAINALTSVEKQRCTDNIFTRLSTRPKLLLWHDFEKWDGNAAFIFKAGLFGDLTRLRYDIPTGRLTVLDSKAGPRHIEAWNDKGQITIVRNQ